jgi:hypothetical protein
MVLLALLLLAQDKPRLSAVFLALGFLTKWYALALLPVFLVYRYYKTRKIDWLYAGIFFGIVGAVTGLTLLYAGKNGLLTPYIFHWSREGNGESLFYLLNRFARAISGIITDNTFLRFVFFLLQFSAIPFALRAPINTQEKLFAWSALSVMTFILFAKFYSAQWILWFYPVFLMLIKNKLQLITLIVFDVVSYLYFPVLWDTLGTESPLFTGIIVLKTVLFVALMYQVAWPIRKGSAAIV